MLLGAQFYGLRDHTQTEDGIAECFRRTKEMGYEAVQISGTKACAPEFFRNLSEQYALPVLCTHSPLDRIIGDTDRLIEEHKIFGCDTIGLGSIPGEYHADLQAFRAFVKQMEEPVKKITAAGLHFAYHNHDFEFKPFGDSDLYEYMITETDWHFIPDVYWMTFAGRDPVRYLERIAGRTEYIHLKDMANDDARGITTCGYGVIAMEPILRAAKAIGVTGAMIEQDNAPDMDGGSFTQMALGAEQMLPLVHRVNSEG